MNLNKLAAEVHVLNHKWWHTMEGVRLDRNREEMLMLVISELAEAMEGERKSLMDDHLPHRWMAEVEMADALIRLLDYASAHGIMIHEDAEPLETLPENHIAGLFRITRCVQRIYLDANAVSDAVKLIQRYCIRRDFDLWSAVTEKLEYNKTRADHTHEARAKANGKKF